MLRHLMLALAFTALPVLTFSAIAQDSDSHDKNLDIRSSVGDLHIGNDADAKKVGLPLYPGARLKSNDENKGRDSNDQANLSIMTDAFGMKLLVAHYDSDDAPAKILDFYRHKLKKYGNVLECRSEKHGGDVDVHTDDKDSNPPSKELKCDQNSGPVAELKVGTEDDQRVVAVEPSDTGAGSSFTLVYVRTRGKRGEI